MREIKFRLRNCVDKIVGYEKWYTGSMDSKNFYIAEPCWLYSKDGKFWNPKIIPHRKKDQFTGKHDKKRTEEYPEGQKIWEGDIYKDAECIISIVKMAVDGWALFPVKKGTPVRNLYWHNVCIRTQGEVIGTIHENPDLLEGES